MTLEDNQNQGVSYIKNHECHLNVPLKPFQNDEPDKSIFEHKCMIVQTLCYSILLLEIHHSRFMCSNALYMWTYFFLYRSFKETRIQRCRCWHSSLFPLSHVSSASTLRRGTPKEPSAWGLRSSAAVLMVGQKRSMFLMIHLMVLVSKQDVHAD